MILTTLMISACTSGEVLPIEPLPTDTQTTEVVILEPSVTPTIVSTNTLVPPTATMEPTFTPTEVVDPNFRVSEKDQAEQIFIPAGEFLMGTNDKDAQHFLGNGVAYPEVPEHTVYLDGYWIDKYEVTNARYAICVEEGACTPPWVNFSNTREEYYGNPEFDNYPVIMVDWWQASAYCEWAGGRLPTEAEWEKAARGPKGNEYPWGTDFDPAVCNTSERDVGGPMRVGGFPAGVSPYGLMDAAGNVYEWVQDWYEAYPGNRVITRDYGQIYRVLRGGSFTTSKFHARCARRHFDRMDAVRADYGFRCAMDVSAEEGK